MDYSYQYAVIGGDLRQVNLVEQLAAENVSICYYGLCDTPRIPASLSASVLCTTSLKDACRQAACIIGPVPFEKQHHPPVLFSPEYEIKLSDLLSNLQYGQLLFGGNLPLEFVKEAQQKGILVTDFMNQPGFVYSNTIATAEGILCEAIKSSPKNLRNSRCALLGYGKCGTTLLWYLNAMGCKTSVFSDDETERAKACIGAEDRGALSSFLTKGNQFDFIFNTIPAKVISSEVLQALSPQVTILDLASAPGGVDYNAAKKLNISAIFCPGLPGKYAPASCALAMKQEIQNIFSILPQNHVHPVAFPEKFNKKSS